MANFPRYHLVLAPEPGGVPVEVRVQRGLKFLLRNCGLRDAESAMLGTTTRNATSIASSLLQTGMRK
jgi:hypothetical protein